MKPDKDWPEGDNYYVQWTELGMAIEFSRIRETDSAIRALVTPVAIMDGGARSRMMAPIWTSLFTLADRERVAKAISECIDGDGAPNVREWKDSVERAFSRAINWRSAPEELVNLAQIEAPPDAGHLVWPLLARNQVNILLADQKSGKSYVALLIAVIVASGRFDLAPSCFRFAGTGPVFLYDSETDKFAQRRRLERVCAGLGLAQIPDVQYRKVRPPFADHLAEYRAELARWEAVLAIVDSLTFAAGGDLNTTETAGSMMNALGELGDDVTKMATAHHNKAARKEGETASVMGSSLFEFKARNIWVVQRQAEAGESKIDQAWIHRYANDDKTERSFGMRLEFNETNTAVAFSAVDATSSAWMAQRAGTRAERIVAALQNTELWKATGAQLAKATGIDQHEIARVCRGLPNVSGQKDGKGPGAGTWYELSPTLSHQNGSVGIGTLTGTSSRGTPEIVHKTPGHLPGHLLRDEVNVPTPPLGGGGRDRDMSRDNWDIVPIKKEEDGDTDDFPF